jgi:hypothetical protein
VDELDALLEAMSGAERKFLWIREALSGPEMAASQGSRGRVLAVAALSAGLGCPGRN